MDSNFNSNISEIAGNADSVTIEAADGKEYTITKKLPVQAGNIFHGLMMKYGIKESLSDADAIIEESAAMLEMLVAVIISANKIKYPELTRNYILGYYDKDKNFIEGNFDEQDLSFIYSMYLGRWFEMTNRKLQTNLLKKKEAAEAREQ